MLLIYFLSSTALICIFYYILFGKCVFGKNKKSNSKLHPISIIVCAKNEAENLTKNIPKLLSQAYPDFELILINDASIDNSLEVMEHFQEKDSRIVIVNVKNNEAFWGSKKYALTLGIKKATHKRLLFTDADCKPSSNLWIQKMTAQLSSEKQLILGYGGYEKKSGILNALIRFETVLTATQYFSYAKAGIPYMGVGRNISYSSELFYEQRGFTAHMDIKSGDDDLFVNAAATKANTAICIDPEAFTLSKPKTSWSAWISQKRRHIGTAHNYKSIHQFLLGLFFCSNLVFWALAIIGFFTPFWQLTALIVGIKITIQNLVLGKAAILLKEKNLLFWLPFLELLLIVFQIVIFISNRMNKPTAWK
ncbi:glycosyltransferase [Patiriisocius sp. Uisw_017]|jgi:glycosyltransferase involved in cell wall biosynthesis|uniref:glycosyltransferase n=1 Tax=Patiriisocius sp. Uisw_017 TaxID=3230968 RepID=UPI0039E85518